ncbi:MAG: hypothetical protein IT165_14730 [Bryobacterales bacterium]|nr:hypothetical protein [Bryobacterales bacterium]
MSSLASAEKSTLLELILELERVLKQPKRHTGAGLRKLHPTGLWEVRAGLSIRLLFRLQPSEVEFMFAGTHDEVKRFLREFR